MGSMLKLKPVLNYSQLRALVYLVDADFAPAEAARRLGVDLGNFARFTREIRERSSKELFQYNGEGAIPKIRDLTGAGNRVYYYACTMVAAGDSLECLLKSNEVS